jgi:hypothetical protein
MNNVAQAFVGGYTVSGTAIAATSGASGKVTTTLSTFAVAQECSCHCSAEASPNWSSKIPPVVFCLGANDGNPFTLMIVNENGQWVGQQHSVNATGTPYHAVFTFGTTAGGAHSVVGENSVIYSSIAV